jgi:hypothetical protein
MMIICCSLEDYEMMVSTDFSEIKSKVCDSFTAIPAGDFVVTPVQVTVVKDGLVWSAMGFRPAMVFRDYSNGQRLMNAWNKWIEKIISKHGLPVNSVSVG